MYDALAAEDPDRIQVWLARHEGDLVAATIGIRVGTHAWYSYGASSTEKREVRGSNAVQWAMMRHALDAGAHVYDLRGITETLDADDSARRADPVQGRHRRRRPSSTPASGTCRSTAPSTRRSSSTWPGAGEQPMSLSLTVDGERWRSHLLRDRPHPSRASCRSPRATATACRSPASPGGRSGSPTTPTRPARRSTLIAVGTYDEVAEAASRYAGDLLVLTPWRPFGAALDLDARHRRPGSCTPSAAPTTWPPCASATPTPGSCSSS